MVTLCKCLRCGYEWMPFKTAIPGHCANPKCKSCYWDIAPGGKARERVRPASSFHRGDA